MPQRIPIVIKYVYSLNSESFFKCCSETTPCSKGLKGMVVLPGSRSQ